MNLKGCRFWDGPIVFQRLARFTTSRPPTSILWYATFDIPTFWCDMRFEELWVTWPNIAFPHKSGPGFVRNWESNNPTSPLQCSFVKIWLSSWLGHEWKFAMAVTTPRNPSCEARFPWKNIRNQGAVGRITCKFTITSERKMRITRENARKVNPANATGFLRGAFSLEKEKECGSGRPHQIWIYNHLEHKTHYGIWKGFLDARFPWKKIRGPGAVGRITFKFTVTLNARRILPEKTQGIWGVGTTRIFLWKLKELAGLVMRDI